MYLNLYNKTQLEQLFDRTLQDPNITLNPDKKALYHCIVEYVDIISSVKNNYSRSSFVNNLKNFILSLPKPNIELIQIVESDLLVASIEGYEAKLSQPYSLTYAPIANFLNNEVQNEVNKLSIIPMKTNLFERAPVSFQRLLEEKFTEIVVYYHKYLETLKKDKFFAAHRFDSELLSNLLDLLQHPIFDIDLDRNEFQLVKLVNFIKLKERI